MELYPLVAPVMGRRRDDDRWSKWVGWWLEAHADVAQRVLGEIETRGPLRARDFPNEERRGGGWGQSKVTTDGLKALRAVGEVMVVGRRAGEQVFDLTARVLPQGATAADLSEEERGNRLLRAAAASYGVCDVDELACFWGQVAWPPEGKLSGREVLERVDAIGLQPVRVKGSSRQWVCLRGDLERLTSVHRADGAEGVSLLSPFDNLLWDRRLVGELFDFDYKLEAYVPAAKRQYGAYVMPVLWAGQPVGRLDPKLDRKRGVLTINGIWLESGQRASAELTAALADALRRFAAFLGAADVHVTKAKPTSLKAALRKAL
jgi:uncharacterized protein YcaQ